MRSWMIGLVLGMLSVLLLPRLPGLPGLILTGALGVSLLGCKGPVWRGLSGTALGCCLALCHGYLLLDRRLPEDCVRQPVALTGSVASLPRTSYFEDGRSRQRFELRVDLLEPRRCAGPKRVLLSYYGPAKISPGDQWEFSAKLARPWGLANPASFNMQAWYAQTGIDAVGSVRSDPRLAVKGTGPPSLADFPDRQRQRISERIASLPLEPGVTAILAALTVADKSGIDTGLWQLFQQFGINHLLVISGLHVGLVAGAAYLLGGALQRGLVLAGLPINGLSAVMALILCGAYTALAGFSVATQRAFCMLLCFLIANLVGRSSKATNNLLLAAVVVMAINPLAALGSGFWLSFSAVAALLWLSHWQSRGIVSRLLSTHLFMSLVMLPMGAWWFGGSSVIAGLANLLMVPLIGLVVVPLALLSVLAMYVLPSVEEWLWQMAAWPLEILLPAARALGGEHSWLYRPLTASLADTVLAATGILLLVLPVSWWVRGLAVLFLLPILVPLAPDAPGADGPSRPGTTRVTVMDVGQGTAVIVRTRDRLLVYDTGGGDPVGANMASTVLLPFLRQQGITTMDTLVLSHPDNDHSAGARTLLSAMPASRVYYGGDTAAVSGARPCRAGQAWRWPGGQQFQFLSPAQADPQSSNDGSCVLQIDAGGHTLLLAGDVERGQERELVRYWSDALASDWLLVGHHGSRTSSSWTLLKHVRPAIAVISSGYANPFGHPHPLVLGRLRDSGATVFSTATGGALQYEFTPGESVKVSIWRQQYKRFWM